MSDINAVTHVKNARGNTWCMDSQFLHWLYRTLPVYKEEADKVIDLEYNTITVKGEVYTQREAIDKMLELLEYVLSHEPHKKKVRKKTRRLLRIWTEVFPYMWW